MKYQNYGRARKQLTFVLLWLSANIVGCSLGWVVAEAAGQSIGRATQWQIGVAVATVLFESVLWICRGAVLYFVGNFTAWKSIDTFILVIAEAFGWLIGEGTYDVNGPVWASAEPIWAVMLASGLWMIIWYMRQPRTGTRRWPFVVVIWTLMGMLGSSLLIGIGIALSMEAGELVSQAVHIEAGWAMSGAIIGLFAGAITGLAFVRLLKWNELIRL